MIWHFFYLEHVSCTFSAASENCCDGLSCPKFGARWKTYQKVYTHYFSKNCFRIIKSLFSKIYLINVLVNPGWLRYFKSFLKLLNFSNSTAFLTLFQPWTFTHRRFVLFLLNLNFSTLVPCEKKYKLVFNVILECTHDKMDPDVWLHDKARIQVLSMAISDLKTVHWISRSGKFSSICILEFAGVYRGSRLLCCLLFSLLMFQHTIIFKSIEFDVLTKNTNL